MTWRNAIALLTTWTITDSMSEPGTEQQDASDMRRLVEGRDSALNSLMDRHSERLFHFLIRQLQNEEDAADIAQEAFVRVYQHCAKFDPNQKFSTWLYTIATNLARDRLKWRARHPQVSLDHTIGESDISMGDVIPDSKPLPDATLALNERAAAVRAAIAELPEDWRTALVLSEYELLPNAEIANVLHCSVKAVESRIYRAKQRLRERLEEELQGA
jgi:RNA polymerase sigma-70 factor (ECF subfamily)